ncbi:MAG TPA: trypsin-like serine protease [Vicinamibacteria bacterium]|jgi:hypothetical protein|nr:trypsin-like serine protease [Vicinamibacteria bacterium]
MRISFLWALLLLTSAPSSMAIVERHDRDDGQYLKLGARFDAVGEVEPDGSGTLVASRWVLTAAHVAAGRGGATAVKFGERRYRVKRAVLHPLGTAARDRPPEVDLALLELETPVDGIAPLEIYRSHDEAGRTAFIVGWGDYGKGGTALTHTDHRRRAATNQVSDAGPRRLFFSFDAPPAGTDLEGVCGPGDSGGPALLESGGRVLVAGVSSAADGPPGNYGLTDIFVRVSAYADWIDKTIHASGAEPKAQP